MHPPNLGGNGGASYSPNVDDLTHGGGAGGGSGVGHRRQEQDHIFCFKIFFSYFPLKPRSILWSGASYSLKNTVITQILPMLILGKTTCYKGKEH